jgi:hypothetical protein
VQRREPRRDDAHDQFLVPLPLRRPLGLIGKQALVEDGVPFTSFAVRAGT